MSYYNLFQELGPPELGAYPVGVTGTRNGWTEAAAGTFAYICLYLLAQPPTDFLHGGCRGVDEEAHEWIGGQFPSCMRHVHLGHLAEYRGTFQAGPNCYVYEARENSSRNAIIATRPKVVIGISGQHYEALRSGTWQTIRMAGAFHRALAREAKLEDHVLYIVYPNGLLRSYRGDFRSEMNPQTVRAGE